MGTSFPRESRFLLLFLKRLKGDSQGRPIGLGEVSGMATLLATLAILNFISKSKSQQSNLSPKGYGEGNSIPELLYRGPGKPELRFRIE